jgi:hypothetical protein
MRNPVGEGPVWQHTRDYYARWNELRYRHPNLSAGEIALHLAPPVEAKPEPPEPAPPQTMAQRLWPYMKE